MTHCCIHLIPHVLSHTHAIYHASKFPSDLHSQLTAHRHTTPHSTKTPPSGKSATPPSSLSPQRSGVPHLCPPTQVSQISLTSLWTCSEQTVFSETLRLRAPPTVFSSTSSSSSPIVSPSSPRPLANPLHPIKKPPRSSKPFQLTTLLFLVMRDFL